VHRIGQDNHLEAELFHSQFISLSRLALPFLADYIAIQNDRLLASSCRPSVCHSVCPSVCNAVHSGSQGRCNRLKVVPACFCRKVPICPFGHFRCRMYRLSTKRTEKRVEENAKEFLRQTIGVYWSCYVLLLTDFVNFGQSRLSGLSLGAFINSRPIPVESDRGYQLFINL